MLHRFSPWFCAFLAPVLGCSVQSQPSGVAQAAQKVGAGADKDITRFSDEFDNPKTKSSWRHAFQEEGYVNQLERFDIGTTQPGWMLMMPYTSGWYKDYRGILAFKEVQGDFVMTTRLRVNRRGGEGPPRTQYSLAGIMVRQLRTVTPQTWEPGQENYVFLSTGAADAPGSYQFEVKTTINSDSQLRISPASSGDAILQVARIGSYVITLKNENGVWSVHQRYNHPGLSGTVQAGLTCYTDWPNVSKLNPQQHNSTVIRNGTPDLVVLYDYVRYRRPKVPASWAGKRLNSPQAVSDQELLQYLGANAAAKE